MKRPSFFIVGNSKSGTSALAQFLREHPQVFVCTPEEPYYFAKDLCHEGPGAFRQKTLDAYLACFADAGETQVCGEASATYLLSRRAAREIHAFDPDARCIALFREPVSFLRSLHLQLLKNPPEEGEVEADLQTALQLEGPRSRGRHLPPGIRVPHLLRYSRWTSYCDNLQRFLEVFPREQLLLLAYDDFKRDNAGVYRRVLEFLGVDPTFEADYRIVNKGGRSTRSRARLRAYTAMIHGSGGFRRPKQLLTRTLPRPLRNRLASWVYRRWVTAPAPALDPTFERALRLRLRPEVERLGALMGRDLVALWGYDRFDDGGPGAGTSSCSLVGAADAARRDRGSELR